VFTGHYYQDPNSCAGDKEQCKFGNWHSVIAGYYPVNHTTKKEQELSGSKETLPNNDRFDIAYLRIEPIVNFNSEYII